MHDPVAEGYRRMARIWSALKPTHRRRVVLGTMLTMSLAARDLLLFLFAASFFALSEATPRPQPPALTG